MCFSHRAYVELRAQFSFKQYEHAGLSETAPKLHLPSCRAMPGAKCSVFSSTRREPCHGFVDRSQSGSAVDHTCVLNRQVRLAGVL